MVPTLPHALASRLPARLRTLVGAGPRGGVVLELELGRGLVEAPPTSPLEAVRSLNRPSLRTVVEALEKACDDEEVVGLVAHVGAWEPTLAQSAELREAVGRLREAGTRTVVWSEAYGELGPGNTPYHLASAFEEVWLQPSGDVGLVGMAGRATFLRGALDKLGVEPQIAQRHEFKSAADTFLRSAMTDPVREMLTRLVTSATDTLVADVAQGRGLTREAVRAALEAGPLTADEALERGLVDRLGYRDEVYDDLGVGAGHQDRADAPALRFVEKHAGTGGLGGVLSGLAGSVPGTADTPVVAVVGAHGAIHLGRSGGANPLGGPSVGSETLGAALRAAGRDDAVKAVVLRVDSPGGSYAASDAVRREVHALRESGTPVVASMGSVAASGGYFIAMPCDRVLASAGTITGSIGVLAGKQVLRELLDKVGIARETVSVGRYADMFDTQRAFDDEEWARLEGWLDRVYDDFTAKAATDRGLGLGDLREVAKGRVWTGADALERGLVDELGGLSRAVDVACGLGGVERGDVHVRTYPRVSPFAALQQPENSEVPAAASAGLAFGEGPPLLTRLLGAVGVAPTGVLTMGLDVRLR